MRRAPCLHRVVPAPLQRNGPRRGRNKRQGRGTRRHEEGGQGLFIFLSLITVFVPSPPERGATRAPPHLPPARPRREVCPARCWGRHAPSPAGRARHAGSCSPPLAAGVGCWGGRDQKGRDLTGDLEHIREAFCKSLKLRELREGDSPRKIFLKCSLSVEYHFLPVLLAPDNLAEVLNWALAVNDKKRFLRPCSGYSYSPFIRNSYVASLLVIPILLLTE